MTTALSMDLQQSSAPLMRQLESAERQSRSRASAWAELESKLRSDLEDNIIQNETLNKQKYEIEVELKQLHRSIKNKELELSTAQSRIIELNDALDNMDVDFNNATDELEKLRNQFTSFRTLAKANESKIRNELVVSLRESEERYNDHIESLEVDLRQEKDKRLLLEEKIKEINASTFMTSTNKGVTDKKPRKRNLGGKDNQADILQSTLFGISGVESISDDENEDSIENESSTHENTQGSFAFIEQLSQALKAAKSEKESLRKQLMDSEEKRTLLENESVLYKDASEKLPALEARVSELTKLNMEKDLEIEAVNQDIFEVRQMYRSQLDVLLEEKATENETSIIKRNEKSNTSPPTEAKPPSPQNVVRAYGMMPSF